MQSLHRILGRLQSQILTPEQQQFQDLCQCWSEIVGTVASRHTRPVTWHRGVLNVATSSATWSQDLTLRRVQIIHFRHRRRATACRTLRCQKASMQEREQICDSPHV